MIIHLKKRAFFAREGHLYKDELWIKDGIEHQNTLYTNSISSCKERPTLGVFVSLA